MAGRFATTQWSMVVAAGDSDHPSRREALAELCEVYWPPVFAYVRHRGYDAEDARDLTQEFFSRLLDKGYVKSAQRDRGKFRTFLLTAVQRFLANEHDRAVARKRGGGQSVLSLDADDAAGGDVPPDRAADPEQAFEKRWALTLLDHVLAGLGEEMAEAGQAERFIACRPFLVADGGGTGEAPRYKDVAERLGIREGAVKVTVHRMRKRYGALLRDAVADTLGDLSSTDERSDRVDGEVRYLLTIVGR